MADTDSATPRSVAVSEWQYRRSVMGERQRAWDVRYWLGGLVVLSAILAVVVVREVGRLANMLGELEGER